MGKVIGKNKILLPKNVDFTKWAVIACDQFTSQPEYWKTLDAVVGEYPSTLKITFPEIYLNESVDARVEKINSEMKRYLADGLFEELNGFVLVSRNVEGGGTRESLVLSVDLETYDYRRVKTEIRATEDTIRERLPVRMKIREEAEIELPHIILLYDDPDKQIIEPLFAQKTKFRKLYDFDLNMDGGHIEGYLVEETEEIVQKLHSLLDPEIQRKKYGTDAGMLFAVGDGNHSMATAKEHWNKIKVGLTEEARDTHPARFALVEILNIYDDGLVFEPIHRVLLNGDKETAQRLETALGGGKSQLTLVFPDGQRQISCPEKSSETITKVQNFIENERRSGLEVDYVHGDAHTASVVESSGGFGILMPEFSKNELFNYVVNVGNLPKKAFSIGSAENKKYYIEAKRIRL